MKSKNNREISLLLACLFVASGPAAADTQRARGVGIPLEGKPGALNAITDVAGIEVGQVTLISGDGKLKRGEGPVRTGVTAIIPRGKNSISPVFAGWATSNSAGEMTGTTWLEERGYFDGPIMITNTHSVGGGTGMVCFGFKGGIGTSSRVITTPIGTYTVGSNDNVIQVSAN